MRVLPTPEIAPLWAELEVQHGLVLDATEPGALVVRWLGPVPPGEEALAAPFVVTDLSWIAPDVLDGILLPAGDSIPGLLAAAQLALRPGGVLAWAGAARCPAETLAAAGFLTDDWPAFARKAATLHTGPTLPPPESPPHRAAGYALLSGAGLEIGAFNEPAPLPANCSIQYFDALSAETARQRFPEINPHRFVEVDHLGELDQGDLGRFPDGSFDFVVCNHVIEHVANPARLVEDLFRIVRPGGHVVLTVPDKRFTFDHERPLTTLEHLWVDYEAEVTINDDAHYREFLELVTPHVLAESAENQARHIELCRERREHAHVWDSHSFKTFTASCLKRFDVTACPVYESLGEHNRLEYFSVWKLNTSDDE